MNQKLTYALAVAFLLCVGLANGAIAAAPVDPASDPATAANPHKWLDFLGYYGEMMMIARAGIMILGTFDLFYLKKPMPAVILLVIGIISGVVGLALPGLLILADTEWATNDAARWNYVQTVKILWGVFETSVCATPFIIAMVRKQPKKHKWFVAAGSGISFLIPIAWVVALHFAFCGGGTEQEPVENLSREK